MADFAYWLGHHYKNILYIYTKWLYSALPWKLFNQLRHSVFISDVQLV